MKQVLVSGGSVHLEDVPSPLVERGCVLIQMEYSCISIGTEMSGVKSSGVSIFQRALQRPQHVKKVFDMLVNEGLTQTRKMVAEKLSVELPTGYSGAGIVIAVGADVVEFAPGDRVACAGSQCAFHAEVVRVPKNLVVAVPDSVGTDVASSVALGAIAMQGVRRACPTLGETFVVVGLGIIGQLTAQMLGANGCRVIGVDLDRDRIALSTLRGMTWGLHPEDGDDVDSVARITGGIGADGVIITAAGPSDAIVSAAFRMCRKKARVVLVGDVGLDLKREDFYAKELDFLISSSYGPGRYDERYEEGGMDYPLAFVRWTEGRNMAEYLRLIADGAINVKSMVASTYPIDQVVEAFSSLQSDNQKPLMVLLSYPARADDVVRCTRIVSPRGFAPTQGSIRVAVVGAGGFAKGMHLPNLIELKNQFTLRAVVSRTGHNAASTAKRFSAQYCSTDFQEVFGDPEVDAVIIATRHDTHAELALQALRSGKHVLLEKPMALTDAQIDDFERFYESASGPTPILLTGFNRRFSPYAQRMASLLKQRSNPMIINYRMNAGYIPMDHWVHGPEGGGRNRGEACHIYDLFTFFTGSTVKSVHVNALAPATAYYSACDNFIATVGFADGSIASITYTALGSKDYPKESMDIFVDGMVISLNDYRSLTVKGARHKPLATRAPEKGQKEELLAFASAIRGESEWPIPLWQQVQATRISNQVESILNPSFVMT